ncbi:MAG: hypothetical protein IJQ31_07300 [Thermoguttaceae bacterium]|nr:hypothetical protein [Thermoguttaceae bacterium]
MTFDQAPISTALAEISAQTGASIVWSKEADSTYISGTFSAVDVNNMLLAIAKRYGLEMTIMEDVFYLGPPSQSDFVSVVVRSPYVDDELLPSLQNCLSDFGKLGKFASCYIVSDYIYNVKKVLDVIKVLREKLGRAYIAEVYFIRMKNSDLIDLQIKLDAENVDLFACSWTLDELFRATLGIEGGRTVSSSVNVPRLYLSEGRTSILSVGEELTRSKAQVSAEGYSSVSGYEKFTDGVEISLTPARIGEDLISVDVNLSVSKFEDSSEEIPANSKSSIKSPGVLVTDGRVSFLGALQSKQNSKGLKFFGGSAAKSDEIVTIWLKIREVSLKN